MRVLVDTNILIDQICQRVPFAEDAAKLLLLGYERRVDLYFCPISFVNTVYVGKKYGFTQDSIIRSLKEIASFCEFAEHTKEVVTESMECEWRDFEDANQYFSAKAAGIDCIVSRDRKGFEETMIPCYTVKDFLKMID